MKATYKVTTSADTTYRVQAESPIKAIVEAYAAYLREIGIEDPVNQDQAVADFLMSEGWTVEPIR